MAYGLVLGAAVNTPHDSLWQEPREPELPMRPVRMEKPQPKVEPGGLIPPDEALKERLPAGAGGLIPPQEHAPIQAGAGGLIPPR
jgi:hypothetical protein